MKYDQVLLIERCHQLDFMRQEKIREIIEIIMKNEY